MMTRSPSVSPHSLPRYAELSVRSVVLMARRVSLVSRRRITKRKKETVDAFRAWVGAASSVHFWDTPKTFYRSRVPLSDLVAAFRARYPPVVARLAERVVTDMFAEEVAGWEPEAGGGAGDGAEADRQRNPAADDFELRGISNTFKFMVEFFKAVHEREDELLAAWDQRDQSPADATATAADPTVADRQEEGESEEDGGEEGESAEEDAGVGHVGQSS